MASAKLEHLACANVPYEPGQRAAEDWIVLRTWEWGDGFLDYGKRIGLGIIHEHLVYLTAARFSSATFNELPVLEYRRDKAARAMILSRCRLAMTFWSVLAAGKAARNFFLPATAPS